MDINNLKKNILQFLGKHFIFFTVQLLLKTVRLEVKNFVPLEKYLKEEKNVIVAFWHGTMILPWYLFRNKKFAGLVSKSKDGEILSKVLNKWNYFVERGSSHKGGKEAMQKIISKVQQNYSIAITPDGPTGPPFKMKAGAVIAAKKTGRPLFLAGVAFKKKIMLKSWDRFQIPYPFTKAVIIFSDEIFIDDQLEYEETDKLIEQTGNRLNELQIVAKQIVESN